MLQPDHAWHFYVCVITKLVCVSHHWKRWIGWDFSPDFFPVCITHPRYRLILFFNVMNRTSSSRFLLFLRRAWCIQRLHGRIIMVIISLLTKSKAISWQASKKTMWKGENEHVVELTKGCEKKWEKGDSQSISRCNEPVIMSQNVPSMKCRIVCSSTILFASYCFTFTS